jgi:hypothetical protein
VLKTERKVIVYSRNSGKRYSGFQKCVFFFLGKGKKKKKKGGVECEVYEWYVCGWLCAMM